MGSNTGTVDTKLIPFFIIKKYKVIFLIKVNTGLIKLATFFTKGIWLVKRIIFFD